MQAATSPATVDTVGGIDLLPDEMTMVARASHSVAMLTAITEENGKTHMQDGTSFCVDERGYFLTALHYVQGCTSSYIVFGADIVPTTLVAVDEDLDLALFIARKAKGKFAPLSFAVTALEKDDLVIGLGFPAGRLITSLVAYVASYQGQFVGGLDPQQPGIECPTLPESAWFIGGGIDLSGFSGGPMLNQDGLVVAITEMGDGDIFVAGTKAEGALKFLTCHLPADATPPAS